MTGPREDVLRFIGSTFRSVWALELLLLLKGEQRLWSRPDLVTTLRASELVVNKTLDELMAGGLVSIEGEGIRYQPVTEDLGASVEEVEKLYAARPDAVRRVIVASSASEATAFANAFKLRKE